MSLWCITPWNTYWSTGRTLGIPEALLLVLLSWLRSVEGEHSALEEGQFRKKKIAIFFAFLFQYQIFRYIGTYLTTFSTTLPRKTL